MPYSLGRRRGRPDCVEQVFNAPDSAADLTPVSQVPAETTHAGWSAWLRHQPVPLIWERVRSDEPCDP